MTTKLIRDNVVNLAWSVEEAKRAVRKAHSTREYEELLRLKMLEETGKFNEARLVPEVLDEGADVLEVILARLAMCGVRDPLDKLLDAAERKRAVRGGFYDRYVLDLQGAARLPAGADLHKTVALATTAEA